jgi:rhodanese-related sulfurtransferase
MKKTMCVISIFLCVFLCACVSESKSIGITGGADGPTAIMIVKKGEKMMYDTITAETAKNIMDSEKDFVILDTREQYEYDEGHIPGAILIPYTEIINKSEDILPDKDKIILVYCRSGRRSKIAAEYLAGLGYTNVKEFGGIVDWPYEIEKMNSADS